MRYFNVEMFLLVANAFELGVSIVASIVLFRFILANVGDWRVCLRKFLMATRFKFQGGPHDLAIAIFAVFVGKILRTEAVWEWRLFDGPLNGFRVALGITISTLGAVCLIRVLAPNRHFNAYWISTVVFGITLATISWWFE